LGCTYRKAQDGQNRCAWCVGDILSYGTIPHTELCLVPFQACLFAPYLISHQIVLCDFSYSTKKSHYVICFACFVVIGQIQFNTFLKKKKVPTSKIDSSIEKIVVFFQFNIHVGSK